MDGWIYRKLFFMHSGKHSKHNSMTAQTLFLRMALNVGCWGKVYNTQQEEEVLLYQINSQCHDCHGQLAEPVSFACDISNIIHLARFLSSSILERLNWKELTSLLAVNVCTLRTGEKIIYNFLSFSALCHLFYPPILGTGRLIARQANRRRIRLFLM